MSSGYKYGEPEPKEKCPYCNTPCYADFCDVGAGMMQVGPYYCEKCGASEAGAYEDISNRVDYDTATGWYRPGSPPGEHANIDEQGNHISWQEADTMYRAKHGVPPRY